MKFKKIITSLCILSSTLGISYAQQIRSNNPQNIFVDNLSISNGPTSDKIGGGLEKLFPDLDKNQLSKVTSLLIFRWHNGEYTALGLGNGNIILYPSNNGIPDTSRGHQQFIFGEQKSAIKTMAYANGYLFIGYSMNVVEHTAIDTSQITNWSIGLTTSTSGNRGDLEAYNLDDKIFANIPQPSGLPSLSEVVSIKYIPHAGEINESDGQSLLVAYSSIAHPFSIREGVSFDSSVPAISIFANLAPTLTFSGSNSSKLSQAYFLDTSGKEGFHLKKLQATKPIDKVTVEAITPFGIVYGFKNGDMNLVSYNSNKSDSVVAFDVSPRVFGKDFKNSPILYLKYINSTSKLFFATKYDAGFIYLKDNNTIGSRTMDILGYGLYEGKITSATAYKNLIYIATTAKKIYVIDSDTNSKVGEFNVPKFFSHFGIFNLAISPGGSKLFLSENDKNEYPHWKSGEMALLVLGLNQQGLPNDDNAYKCSTKPNGNCLIINSFIDGGHHRLYKGKYHHLKFGITSVKFKDDLTLTITTPFMETYDLYKQSLCQTKISRKYNHDVSLIDNTVKEYLAGIVKSFDSVYGDRPFNYSNAQGTYVICGTYKDASGFDNEFWSLPRPK
ncbi:hypothetical protein [Francisella sp. 19X1-34]|uniref:hypothetical protein n=1 Tax=Francisella sp. 19X1-34 TaxID=3087177 RepID=UPI002E32851C|nr:hypothetical protein [Francisella sp. 19X1-34]MED7788954.1 hypothetical protein [Francisella sp. 19X1-34]